MPCQQFIRYDSCRITASPACFASVSATTTRFNGTQPRVQQLHKSKRTLIVKYKCYVMSSKHHLALSTDEHIGPFFCPYFNQSCMQSGAFTFVCLSCFGKWLHVRRLSTRYALTETVTSIDRAEKRATCFRARARDKTIELLAESAGVAATNLVAFRREWRDSDGTE